jgi:hypothetical protein
MFSWTLLPFVWLLCLTLLTALGFLKHGVLEIDLFLSSLIIFGLNFFTVY